MTMSPAEDSCRPGNEHLHSSAGRASPREGTGSEGKRIRVDCRERTAREVLYEILPACLEARAGGGRAVVRVENLELLSDSVTRLLKALDRLTEELGAEVALADSSGLTTAFVDALSNRAHVETAGRK